MKFYVQVIGAYDCTYVGPFDTEPLAKEFADDLPKQFVAYVMTEPAMHDHIAEFGECPIEQPGQFL